MILDQGQDPRPLFQFLRTGTRVTWIPNHSSLFVRVITIFKCPRHPLSYSIRHQSRSTTTSLVPRPFEVPLPTQVRTSSPSWGTSSVLRSSVPIETVSLPVLMFVFPRFSDPHSRWHSPKATVITSSDSLLFTLPFILREQLKKCWNGSKSGYW